MNKVVPEYKSKIKILEKILKIARWSYRISFLASIVALIITIIERTPDVGIFVAFYTFFAIFLIIKDYLEYRYEKRF